jgi:hypothetical protein
MIDMLKWEKDINGYNGNWMGGYIGFDDDCPLYRVGRDDNGWYYEFLAAADGFDGYESAEEAMAAAEADYKADLVSISQMFEEEELLTFEDLEDIHWDEVAHERMEIAKGLF